jgi:hypothetical protein
MLDGEMLDGLPLARVRGGLTGDEYDRASTDQRNDAAIHLKGASLRYARLEGSSLTRAHLEGANLHYAHLEGADLYKAHFEADVPADLTLAILDASTRIGAITLANAKGIGPRLEGTAWNRARLGDADWLQVSKIGDEVLSKWNLPPEAERVQPISHLSSSVHAYRQLAVALREQGLNEDADRFAYRAQVLQRRVMLRQGHLVRAFGSWLLDLVSGLRVQAVPQCDRICGDNLPVRGCLPPQRPVRRAAPHLG